MEGDQCNRHGSGDRNWIINLVAKLIRENQIASGVGG